jgi:type IV secretory pathway component VirB8
MQTRRLWELTEQQRLADERWVRLHRRRRFAWTAFYAATAALLAFAVWTMLAARVAL